MADQLARVRIALGVAVLVGGGLGVAYPYKIARFEEIVDAIGSTRGLDAVEPAGWKVTLTRITSLVVVLGGLWWILLGFGGM